MQLKDYIPPYPPPSQVPGILFPPGRLVRHLGYIIGAENNGNLHPIKQYNNIVIIDERDNNIMDITPQHWRQLHREYYVHQYERYHGLTNYPGSRSIPPGAIRPPPPID